MDELNGRLLACQVMLTGLIARVANVSSDPLAFLSEYRDEVRAVVNGLAIGGIDDAKRIRAHAIAAVDELFGLMKPPSHADGSE